MGRKAVDLTGNVYGMLRVLEQAASDKSKKAMWKCLCECGNICVKLGRRLVSGKTRSCGCLTTATHGMSRHPLYGVWNSMIQRCHNPASPSFERYGAKGIEVCEEWRTSSSCFFKWALEQWDWGLSIDRIDDRLGYFPSNCRFIPLTENIRRQRRVGRNVGRVFDGWRITGLIPGSTKVSVECVKCKRPAQLQQSNVTQLRCRKCICHSTPITHI